MKFLIALGFPGLLAAADLSTVLEIGLGEGAPAVTYQWSVLAMPAGASPPRFATLPIESGPATNRVRADLPAAQPGRYRFLVEVRHGEVVLHQGAVEVEVQPGGSSPVAQIGAESGCASGSAMVLAGAFALIGFRSGRRRS